MNRIELAVFALTIGWVIGYLMGQQIADMEWKNRL